MGSSSSKAARREAEQARLAAEQARRDAEQAQRVAEQAQRVAEQAQREVQAARDEAQKNSSAREEAERKALEARLREEQAERARQEAERAAHSWEKTAAAGSEQARRESEQTRRDAEQARRVAEQARRDAEQAQREAQEARNQAQQDSSAREEAERKALEARQREEQAERARQEAERAAHSWEEAAADAEQARKAAEEARQAAEERLRQGIPPEYRPTSEQVQQSRERHGYGAHALNIAVVGESGVGKSALLNAVRGLWPEDPGAAAVGVDETTAVVQGYVDPRHPQVKWFDVPGANTPNVSGWLYFMNQSLYIFDILVILFSGRFTQTVGTLLSNAHRCSIQTFLVRTKADQFIHNLKKDRRGRLTDAEAKRIFISCTRDMVYKNLNTLKLPLQPVFVVSEDGMRDWVTAGDTTNVIDEQVIYQSLFPESSEQDSGAER